MFEQLRCTHLRRGEADRFGPQHMDRDIIYTICFRLALIWLVGRGGFAKFSQLALTLVSVCRINVR